MRNELHLNIHKMKQRYQNIFLKQIEKQKYLNYVISPRRIFQVTRS